MERLSRRLWLSVAVALLCWNSVWAQTDSNDGELVLCTFLGSRVLHLVFCGYREGALKRSLGFTETTIPVL